MHVAKIEGSFWQHGLSEGRETVGRNSFQIPLNMFPSSNSSIQRLRQQPPHKINHGLSRHHTFGGMFKCRSDMVAILMQAVRRDDGMATSKRGRNAEER